jgi:hypothetical protein
LFEVSFRTSNHPKSNVAHLLDHLNLSVEPGGAALDQRDIGCQAHLVDMPPRIQIVQRIEDKAELLKPCHIELAILDVVVVRFDVDVGVELSGRLFRDLLGRQRKLYYLVLERFVAYFCLGLLDVLVAK